LEAAGRRPAGEADVTEGEWLKAKDPDPMLAALWGKASRRKLRLFACGCCRHVVWHLLRDPRYTDAVPVAESFADGLAGAEQLRAVNESAAGASMAERYGSKAYHAALAVVAATRTDWLAKVAARFDAPRPDRHPLVAGEAAAAVAAVRAGKGKVAALLREIFGPLPFRRARISPAWLAPSVLSIARRAYEERDFAALPVLADALEDAGCTAPDLLSHLRGPGPHYRGCWAIDLILGKR
jgi:hypothetical protein